MIFLYIQNTFLNSQKIVYAEENKSADQEIYFTCVNRKAFARTANLCVYLKLSSDLFIYLIFPFWKQTQKKCSSNDLLLRRKCIMYFVCVIEKLLLEVDIYLCTKNVLLDSKCGFAMQGKRANSRTRFWNGNISWVRALIGACKSIYEIYNVPHSSTKQTIIVCVCRISNPNMNRTGDAWIWKARA